MINNDNSSIKKRKYSANDNIIPDKEKLDNRYTSNNNTSYRKNQQSESSSDSYYSSESRDDNSKHYNGVCGDVINNRCKLFIIYKYKLITDIIH